MYFFEGKGRPKTPILRINNINEEVIDLDMLQLFMAHRKRSDGGEIADWKVNTNQATGSASVIITYKEQGSKFCMIFQIGTPIVRVTVGCASKISTVACIRRTRTTYLYWL